MLYDSKALRIEAWEQQKEVLISEGWEYNTPYFGVVYIRKNIDGEENTDSKGWVTEHV